MRAVRIFAAFVFAAFAAVSEAAGGQTSEWWKVPEVQRQVRLAPAQVTALDVLFRGSLAERKRLRAELDRLEAKLQRALEQADLDCETAVTLIDKVERTRAQRNTQRAVMLLRMYKILTADQRMALRQLSGEDFHPRRGAMGK
jgi:Spy/CpxP family protein refolding chaperone